MTIWGDRPARPERLFYGLFPDAMTTTCLSRLAGDLKVGGSLIRPDRRHVSLHHVGDFPRLKSTLIYAACRAG